MTAGLERRPKKARKRDLNLSAWSRFPDLVDDCERRRLRDRAQELYALTHPVNLVRTRRDRLTGDL